MQGTMKKHMDIDLLCLICNRSKSKDVEHILKNQHIFFNLVMLGKGTASSKVLKYLGLGETEKAMFFCVAPQKVCDEASQLLDEKLQLKKAGNGIMFRIKINQGCYHQPINFIDEENGEKAMEGTKNNLIMIIANRGYSDEVMDAARAGGASGGTILHVRGGGSAGMEKFFGVTIAPDKEMILIVAPDEMTDSIMSEIAKDNGPESDAACVSFAVPVTHVEGVRDYSKIVEEGSNKEN